jgi:hypothetical protein
MQAHDGGGKEVGDSLLLCLLRRRQVQNFDVRRVRSYVPPQVFEA